MKKAGLHGFALALAAVCSISVSAADKVNLARAEEIVVPVQVNGKVRSRLTVPAEASEKELEEMALADPAVMAHLAGKQVKKVVVAKGRLVSLVV